MCYKIERMVFVRSRWIILAVLLLLLIPDCLNAARAGRQYYSIQIAAYKDLKVARQEVGFFKSLKQGAFYKTIIFEGKGKWYRIYIGKFETGAKAERAARKLRLKKIISNYYIRSLKAVEKKPVKTFVPTHPEKKEASTTAGANKIISNQKSYRSQKDEEKVNEAKTALIIRDITFVIDQGEQEKVFIHANRYFWPSVLFKLKSEKPGLTLELRNVTRLSKDFSKVHVNGEWIKAIRTRHHEKSKTLNIDLDFNHSKGYAINQIFTRAENIFGIVLTAEGKATNQEDIIAELKTEESHQKIKVLFSGPKKKTGQMADDVR